MKMLFVCLHIMLFTTTCFFHVSAQDPIIIVKEAVKKAVVAIDLKIQRLQTKTIWLQHAQKAVENKMTQLKLDEITDWVQKQKDLYQNYFDELWRVKDALTFYYRVEEQVQQQMVLVKAYKRAWNSIRHDNHFTADEVLFIGGVYTGIIKQSVNNLDQLSLVIQSFALQMSDAERLELLNRVTDAMQHQYNDLNAFTTQNILLSLARSKDKRDITVVKTLYGIQN